MKNTGKSKVKNITRRGRIRNEKVSENLVIRAATTITAKGTTKKNKRKTTRTRNMEHNKILQRKEKTWTNTKNLAGRQEGVVEFCCRRQKKKPTFLS